MQNQYPGTVQIQQRGNSQVINNNQVIKKLRWTCLSKDICFELLPKGSNSGTLTLSGSSFHNVGASKAKLMVNCLTDL